MYIAQVLSDGKHKDLAEVKNVVLGVDYSSFSKKILKNVNLEDKLGLNQKKLDSKVLKPFYKQIRSL